MEWTRDGKMCRQAFFLKLAVVAWAWILFFICLKEKFIFSKVDLSLNILGFIWFISVTQLCPTLCDPEPQHTRPPCPSPTPRVHPNPYPLCWWCHPTISSSVVPFSSRPQSFPASGSFVGKVMSLLFNMLSRLIITFLLRSKHLLISWLQSPSAVILEPPKIKSATDSPSVCHEVVGPDAMILVFWMLSFKPNFSLLFHFHQEAL